MKKKRTIKIDEMKIRLNGVSPQDVRFSATEIGSELLTQLVEQESFTNLGNSIRINRVEAGAVKLNGEAPASGLPRMIAEHAARAIRSKGDK